MIVKQKSRDDLIATIRRLQVNNRNLRLRLRNNISIEMKEKITQEMILDFLEADRTTLDGDGDRNIKGISVYEFWKWLN